MSDKAKNTRVRTPISPGHAVEGEVLFWYDDPDTGLQVLMVRYERDGAFEYVARQPGQVTIVRQVE